MSTTAERYDVEPQLNGFQDRFDEFMKASEMDPSEHPLLRQFDDDELLPARIHDDLTDEIGDPLAEPELEEEEIVETKERRSKFGRALFRAANWFEARKERKEGREPLRRRVGNTALNSVRNGIDRMGMNTPESLERQGIVVKKVAAYRSPEAKNERVKARKEKKNHKIIDKSQTKVEKANTKFENKINKVKTRHSRRLDTIENKKNFKQEKLDLTRRQRIGSFLGSIALINRGIDTSYSRQPRYGSYGRKHRTNRENAVRVSDLTAEA